MCVELVIATTTTAASPILRVKIRDALVHREVLVATQPGDLFGLFGVLQHGTYSGVVGERLTVRDAAEARVRLTLLDVPLVQLFHICRAIDEKQATGYVRE